MPRGTQTKEKIINPKIRVHRKTGLVDRGGNRTRGDGNRSLPQGDEYVAASNVEITDETASIILKQIIMAIKAEDQEVRGSLAEIYAIPLFAAVDRLISSDKIEERRQGEAIFAAFAGIEIKRGETKKSPAY